ncbi:hypothetical protein HYW20_06095 [Candidatus Woesearchaeota archaeon]|nr:hypothetical protein [Candidatus Woesearchaeota archaeon]
METEKQELGHLVAKAVRFVRDKKEMRVYLKRVDGLSLDDKYDGSLPDGKYRIGIGNPDYRFNEGAIVIGKRQIGGNSEVPYLHLIRDDCEFQVGHSDSSVFFKQGNGHIWSVAKLQGKPSLSKLVQDVIHEAAGIPTIVTRGYDNATKQPGKLIILAGYQPLKSQQTQ